MRIIIGLGNPGKKYEGTRHNVGFAVIDRLRSHWNFPEFVFRKKFNAETSEETVSGEKIVLVKPHTFMNLSGICVQALLRHYKQSPKDIFVIQDDLDLPIGTLKIAINSSSAGHNGIKNIIEQIGTQQFHRCRIGIAPDQNSSERECENRKQAHRFVLEKHSDNEWLAIEALLPEIQTKTMRWIKESPASS